MPFGITELVFLISMLLLVANFVLFFSRKLNMPYAIVLFLIGITASNILPLTSNYFPFVSQLSEISLSPELLLSVFLPPLLFESSFNIDFRRFKKDFSLIAILATWGVLISSFVLAFSLSALFSLPFYISLLFAAVISSTDPIAVIAIFKDLGLSKRLIQLIDSESMLNDATSFILVKSIFRMQICMVKFSL